MYRVRTFIVTAALAFMASIAQATPLAGWAFNGSGTGFSGAQAVNDGLAFSGNGFIQGFNFGASGFDFVENGVYTFGGASGLTMTYRVSGSQLATGIDFRDGVSEITTENPGFAPTRVAALSLQAGGSTGIDQVEFTGLIDILAPGYFFTADGTDLYGSTLEFSIAILNALAQPDDALVEDLICRRVGFDGPGCNGEAYDNNLPFYWLVADLGSLNLTATVPEPASIALLLAGLAALGLRRRRPAA